MFRKFNLTVLLFFALLLNACSSLATTPQINTFTDGLGRKVEITGNAQRIISLAPSNTELLFAIGAGQQIIGRDELSDFPAEAKALPSLGGYDKYNLEQIVALKPDLVILAEIHSPDLVKQLQDLGLNVFYLTNPKTFDDLYANLNMLAKITGHQKDAAALIVSLKERVSTVTEKIKTVQGKPVVFYELDSTDPAKPYTFGQGTFVNMLLEQAGGTNLSIAAGITDSYPQVSIEKIVSIDPDLIILGDSMWGVTVESVGQRPGWEKLKAVTSQKVFTFDDNLVSRPGPRLVDGLETLARLLHPELFK